MGESIKIAIEDLFDTSGILPTHSARLLIERAEVVVILDRDSGHQTVVYGLEKLQQQMMRARSDTPLMLLIEYDEKTDDLVKVFGLIQAIKGQDEDHNGKE